MSKDVLKVLFTPLYYNNREDYNPIIPDEFWDSEIGNLIKLCFNSEQDIMISTSEAAEVLGFSRQNVNNIAKDNKIASIKIGNYSAFNLLDVLTYKHRKNN